MTAGNPPAPRLEFQWRKDARNEAEAERASDDTWFCDYGIVMPLQRLDIRAEGEDGEKGAETEIFYQFGTTVSRGSDPVDGYTPYRDSAHASWDSEALGGLPIWVKSISGNHAPKPAAPAA